MSPNVAASVHQRLLNLARRDDRRFNDILQNYALERWLYRLSQSPHADSLILKGALMLVAWGLPVLRPTRDIDMLARADSSHDSVRQMVTDICSVAVVDDGMVFDPSTIQTVPIAEDALYEGVRATFKGTLGRAKTPMQIDLGFSDVVTPGPETIEYPTALDFPAPRLQAYSREATVAEKLHAMVKLGELNSRVKDFFDIWVLARSQSFEGAILTQAVADTFARRATDVSPDAVCFDAAFGSADAKQTQWRAFLRRSNLARTAPEEFVDVWRSVVAFVRPLASGEARSQSWQPGGPWG